jgi:hypothetical protein
MGWMSLASLQKGAVLTYQERGKATRIFLPSRVNLEIKKLAFPFTHAGEESIERE